MNLRIYRNLLGIVLITLLVTCSAFAQKTAPGGRPGNGRASRPVVLQTQIRFDSRQVRPESVISIPLWLEFPNRRRSRDSQANISNLNAEITYDPSVLKPDAKVIAGDLLEGVMFTANTEKAGIIRIAFAAKDGIKTSGTLAKFTFRVIGKPGKQSPLSIKITTVNDDEGNTPNVMEVDGAIRIIQAGKLGDINGNGIIDAGDALVALKMSVGLVAEDRILDVDKRDGVTSSDARMLLRMAVGETITVIEDDDHRLDPKNDPDNERVIIVKPDEPELSPYDEYIKAYNRLTSLMAAGKGNTPEAKEAYEAYRVAKKTYEEALKNAPPLPPVDDEPPHK